MLEIDKLKERFPDCNVNILREYARDFLKPDDKDKMPPNPPPTDNHPKELFDLPVKGVAPKDS